MREYPFLFSNEMVRAILEGRKSQTRGVITSYNSVVGEDIPKSFWVHFSWKGENGAPLPWVDGDPKRGGQYLHVPWKWAENETIFRIYPRYKPGDRLWVKETWWLLHHSWGLKDPKYIRYKAAVESIQGKEETLSRIWLSPILMPKWAARIWLEITAIRAQRVQEISEEDIKAEGCPAIQCAVGLRLQWFRILWDSLNHKRGYGWDFNPWDWVYEFNQMKGAPSSLVRLPRAEGVV